MATDDNGIWNRNEIVVTTTTTHDWRIHIVSNQTAHNRFDSDVRMHKIRSAVRKQFR